MRSAAGPGIIVNSRRPRGVGAQSPSGHSGFAGRPRRRSSRRSTIQLDDRGVDGIDIERLSFINTALEAVPGMTLKRFFTPIMRVRSRMLMRRRATVERLKGYFDNGSTGAAANKLRRDAINQLAAALTSAAADVLFDAPLAIDVNALAALLADKLEPVSYRAGDTLALPCEPPEAAFVYMVVHGSVRATHYHPQLRRAAPTAVGAGSGELGGGGGAADGPGSPPAAGVVTRADRKQFFTSSEEVFHLCTVNGLQVDPDAADGADAGAVISDVASMSNVTTAIHRSLRKASRAVGQPTLQVSRTEVLRAPCVLGAAEALGLAPGRCVSYAATATAAAGNVKAPAASDARGANTFGGGDVGGVQYVTYTDIVRVRAVDVHAALVELAWGDRDALGAAAGEWFSAPLGVVPPRGVRRTVADFIAAARARALSLHYPQNEILMRQSWLLQDTPPATLRSLISRLTPRTYMPGEVVACPHVNSSTTRQLCFLRRGRLVIAEGAGAGVTDVSAHPAGGAGRPRIAQGGVLGNVCGYCTGNPKLRPREVVHAGSSFGELSVLFGEARGYTLIADSVCDVWCLPHADFARTMRRDESLRATLVNKAAALRIRWLGEQRFTAALADHLRTHSELLRPFPPMALRLIQERMTPVVYSPGQLLTSTSERAGEVIFIMQGRVESVSEGIASYGPGDVIGEGCLVAHRWPLALAAATMVEGWRLPRDRLVDALRRADILHAHSGEVTSQAPIYLKNIFQPPVPEAESDVVGRLRMPVVGPAPGGLSYVDYARRAAELLLKALCFTLRDVVKWEDINYATMDGPKGRAPGTVSAESAAGDALARTFALAKMRGETGGAAEPATSIAGVVAAQATAARPGGAAPAPPAAAAGSGRAAVAHIASARGSTSGRGRPRRAGLRKGGGRRRRTGACAFLVSEHAMGGGPGGEDAYPGSSPAALAEPSPAVRRALRVPPRLRSMTQTLAERDRTLASELRQEAELERKLEAQKTACVREHVAAAGTPTLATRPGGGAAPLPPGGAQTPGEPFFGPGALFARAGARLAATASVAFANPRAALVGDPMPPHGDAAPPVHLFLAGDRPRATITMAEALTVGYVLQLPDPQSIQACVSFVDPDVTVGPPGQRTRRRAMAVTPNERYDRHNFLFAAAVFENISELEEALNHTKEGERMHSLKAQKLTRMMRVKMNSARWQAYSQGQTGGGAGGGRGGRDPLSPHADAAGGESPSRERSPFGSIARARSPSGVPATPMHQGAGVVVTPSPFRGSPGQTSVKKTEAFGRLLRRETGKAMDLLYAKYQVPPPPVSDRGAAHPPLLDAAAEESAAPSTRASTADESRPRALSAPPGRRPPLLDRLLDAAALPVTDDAQDGVALTDTAAPPPALPMADYRDRNRAQLQYLGAAERSLAPRPPAAAAGSPRSASTSILLQGHGAQTATVEGYLTNPKGSFVYADGFGLLDKLSPEAAAGVVVLAPEGGAGDSLGSALGMGGAGRRSRTNSRSVTATFLGGSATAPDGAGVGSPTDPILGGVLTPQDFVMPDVDDASTVMRRFQRDVEGLNAVAREQTRERQRARRMGQRPGAKAAAQALAVPSAEEEQVLTDWQQASRLLSRDPIMPIVVPCALWTHAGSDHLRRGVAEVHHALAQEAAREAAAAGVTAWQDEQLLSSASRGAVGAAAPTSTTAAAALADPRRGSSAAEGAATGPVRTIAAIGSSQFGHAAVPLVSPAALAGPGPAYQAYTEARKAFFEAFQTNPAAVLAGEVAEPQVPAECWNAAASPGGKQRSLAVREGADAGPAAMAESWDEDYEQRSAEDYPHHRPSADAEL